VSEGPVKRRITIGGIGSLPLGDDGVGPYVVHILEKGFRFDDCFTLVNLGTPGLDLVAHLSGVDALTPDRFRRKQRSPRAR